MGETPSKPQPQSQPPPLPTHNNTSTPNIHPTQMDKNCPLGILITNIFAFKITQRMDKWGALKHMLGLKCHSKLHQTTQTKWIPEAQLLNPDNILYNHNLFLVSKLTQHTKIHAYKLNFSKQCSNPI